MKKTFSIIKCLFLLQILILFFLTSCSKKNNSSVKNIEALSNIEEIHSSHQWFYFDGDSIKETSSLQNVPSVAEKPWTEAVRISSAASLPHKHSNQYKAYALLNRCGLIAFTEDSAELFKDNSLFLDNSVQGLVFSSESPVFYLYRSTFFFDEDKVSKSSSSVQTVRPFLVEFDFNSKNFYPLVSYQNMKLEKEDQITGCFWDGSVWVVAAKNADEKESQFKYLYWKPPLALGDLNPALGGENFFIRRSTEEEYLSVCMPKLFNKAPSELKSLLSSLPENFSFYISYRDDSGTSPVSYYQEGSFKDSSLQLVNASAMVSSALEYSLVLFADGTVFAKNNLDLKTRAFRLPKLPDGFVYGDFAIAGSVMYAAWEEASFWQTKRAGFIKLSLSDIL